MSTTFDCSDDNERARGILAAKAALSDKKLVVLPTDTVYGVAADAFSPDAVQELLLSKGRGRAMPPPVLIGSAMTVDGVATNVSPAARSLMQAFWPGALTIIVESQPSLDWDLGDTYGTVAVRVPQHPVALELLRQTGPLAVSSANRSGKPPAQDAADAYAQLGDLIEVYLAAERCSDDVPSTIVDATRGQVRVVRQGAISLEALREVVPEVQAFTPHQGDADSKTSADSAAK